MVNWDEHDRLRGHIKARMGEKRYRHTLGVESEADKLAGIFGCGPELAKKIKSAALLHDISKELGRREQLGICGKYKIKLSKNDMRVGDSLHGRTGAYIARHEFGACDEIFNAVYCHTFGADYNKSGLLCKIICLADYIEPNRSRQDNLDAREYFYENLEGAEELGDKYIALDKAMLFLLNQTLLRLVREDLFIHKDTIKNRNSFVLGLKND